MQPSKKSFSIDTDAVKAVTTYQPSFILFQVLDKRTNKIKVRMLQNSSLPSNIKQDCEKVSHLYEFLQQMQQKSPQDIQVDWNTFTFKVVHFMREREYSLDLHEIFTEDSVFQQEKMEEQGGMFCEKKERNQFIIENEALKQQIRRLQNENDLLKQRLNACQPLQSLPTAKVNKIFVAEESKFLTLTPSKECKGAQSYSIANDTIKKLTDQPNLLIFQQRVNDEKVHFTIKIDSQLNKNWIIFGIIAKEYFDWNFCLFQENCIAFSGLTKMICNEKDVIDLKVVVKQGTTICMQIDPVQRLIVWKIDGRLICKHRISVQMLSHSLHPYLMLAKRNDQIIFNID